MANLEKPLYRWLEKNNEWKWGDAQQDFFEKLKTTLAEAPLLCLYDKELPLKLACETSSYDVGAVLSHVYSDKSERPILYASRTLNIHEKNYSQLDKEGVAIMFGLKKFHQYIYGRKFTICTDNKALSHIFDPQAAIPSLAAARLVRWSVQLCSYDYSIELKSTTDNTNADILSRLPLPKNNSSLPNGIDSLQIDFLPLTADKIRDATSKDPVLKKVVNHLYTG